MSGLPSIDWNLDPVFVTVPQAAVVGVAAAVALYSFVQGARKKGSDHTSTGLLFALLGFVAWKYMDKGLELRYYSMLFVGVFLGGYALLKWQIERGGGPPEDAGDFIVYGVLGVLLGARLGHVLFYDFQHALEDPAWVLKIWTGGLASHGAVLGLILAMYLFTRRRGIPFIEGSDRFAFSAALGAGLVRLGNLLNSEIVGRVVPDQSWGFRFLRYSDDQKLPQVPLRYPTQIAELLLGFGVLGVLYLFDQRLGREKRPRGALISMFFLLYFTGRFFIEFYKEYENNGGMVLGLPITMGQALSLPGIVIGIVGLTLAFKKRIPVGWPNVDALDDEPAPRKSAKGSAKKAEPEDDDEDEDEKRDEDERDEDEKRDEDERDEDEDEKRDEDERDEDERDEDEDDAPSSKKPSVDPDVAAEFDDKGSLKRRRD
jgi:phosphatidylglycerol:prolipoprotein diacylglycerol transferase